MKIERFKGGYDRNFCYLVSKDDVAILIDPFPHEELDQAVTAYTLAFIINTHTHFDHTSGNNRYAQPDTTIVTHANGSLARAHKVQDNDELKAGKLALRFLHTPGHSADSMCILIGDALFTGDTLFVDKIGGTGTEEAARQQYDALRRLLSLPGTTRVYPGHDYGTRPESTLQQEATTNPFLRQSSFDDFLQLKLNWRTYKKKHNIS